MAETFSDEGLQRILGVWPKNGTNDASLFLGLFSSQTATTVPAQTAVLATQTGVAELASTGGYARATITAASWGAATTSGTGDRVTTSSAISFASSSGAYGATVNGFFIAAGSSTIGAGVGIGYANFSDLTAVTVNAANFTIQITPFIHFEP